MERDRLSTGAGGFGPVIRGYSTGINLIYGSAGSGKSTLCLIFAKEHNSGKIIYVYDGHISGGRIRQILTDKELKNITFFKIDSMTEIQRFLFRLNNEQTNVRYVIIDGISNAYHNDSDILGSMNANQVLRECAALMHSNDQVSFLLTTQIYSDLDNGIKPLGGWAFRGYAEKILYLEKGEHFNLLRCGGREVKFIIYDKGIKVI